MKKALSLILTLVLSLSLCACGGGNPDTSNPTDSEIHNSNINTNTTTAPKTEAPSEKPSESPTENTTDDREVIYSTAVAKLNTLVGDSREAVSLTEEDATYLINEFTALGDYKDSAKILDRFDSFSNMLLYVEDVTSDKIGNQSKERIYYSYDSQGRLIQTTDEHIVKEFGIEVTVGYPNMTIVYAENGQISEIVVKSYGTITARVTPTYDEKGNISSMFIINQYGTTYGEYTAYFEYDENNCLVSSIVPLGVFGNDNLVNKHYTYSYNQDNLLDKKTAVWSYPGGSDRSEEIVYFYESGRLAREEKIYTESATPGFEAKLINTTYSYSYNVDGLVERVAIETDNPQVTAVGHELVYFYANLYFYTPQN